MKDPREREPAKDDRRRHKNILFELSHHHYHSRSIFVVLPMQDQTDEDWRILPATFSGIICRIFLDCHVVEPLRRATYGFTPSIFDLLSRPWAAVARLLVLRGVDPHPMSGNGRKATASKIKIF